DRAVDEPWVERLQELIADAELVGHAGRITLDQDVRVPRERQKALTAAGRAQIEYGAALAPLPYVIAELVAEGIAARRLDLGDHRAMVRKQHRGHGACNTPGEIQNADSVENSSHVVPLNSPGRRCAMRSRW